MSIRIENTVYPSTPQWKAAIRGMRNAKRSWDKSDTDDTGIGEADLKLMRSLVQAGPSHRKFLRMLPVITDITAPSYWVAELDTYKLGTTRNSCSFMHTGTMKPFTKDDFSVEDETKDAGIELILWLLNILRDNYLVSKDESEFREIRNLLPSGYNIRFTWSANYETLLNIYNQRKSHRLPEWHTFCEWIEQLPYFKEICLTEVEVSEQSYGSNTLEERVDHLEKCTEKPMPENKTRLQALLEVLPNIERDDDGYPWNCIDIYDTDQEMQNNYDCSQGCEECKKRFWEAKEK